MEGVFRIVKTKAGLPIKAFRTYTDMLGADMLTEDYIKALAAEFGSPVFVLSRAQLEKRLFEAAARVQMQMQESTVAVAALPIPPITHPVDGSQSAAPNKP